jgi:hypothetical protein
MGIGLRELIIILLVVGIVFLPWFRKVAALGQAPKPQPPLKSRPKKSAPEVIDAEWEEIDD